jgi:tetratricopeptide (TPR) repeat protein
MRKLLLTIIITWFFSGCATEDYWHKGGLAEVKQDYPTALKYYSKGIESSKGNWQKAQSYKRRGKLYEKIGELQKALQDFKLAISFGELSCYMDRGDLYKKINQYENAIIEYTEYMHLVERLPNILINRGDAYYTMNNHHLAQEDYEEAFALISYTLTTDPRMTKEQYNLWKYMILKYWDYFQDEPPIINKAILIIPRLSHDNSTVLYISRFDNQPVGLYDMIINVPSGLHSFNVQYIYYTEENIITSETHTTNSVNTQNILNTQPGENKSTGGSFNVTPRRKRHSEYKSFYNKQLDYGHIYTFEVIRGSSGIRNNYEIIIKDITEKELIGNYEEE